MGKAIPPCVRSEIVRLCKTGMSAAKVSKQLNLGYAGVAKVWRQYRKEGQSALALGYARCGRPSSYDEDLKQRISQMLEVNEQLGAPIIRSRLLAEGNYARVPHERTIQRWMKASGKNKPRGRRPNANSGYATEVHHTWQVDGKENVTLANGDKVSYLSCADEACGGYLQGYVFPLSSFDAPGQPPTG